MAATVTSVTPTIVAVDQTAHLVAMPATVVAGELLVCFFSNDGSATVTAPSGWTQLYTLPQGTVVRGGAYAKVAAGTEGGTTVDFVTSAVEQCAAQVYRITGWSGTLAGVEAGTAVQSTNSGLSTTDPPGVTASWGALANLFITGLSTSSSQTIVSQPSGWGTPTKTNEGAAGGNVTAQIFTSVLASTAAAGDPGVWTLSGTSASTVANTIVVRPAAAPAGRTKVWSGSAWVQKPAKVWSGSAWVTKPVEVWNGSAWV